MANLLRFETWLRLRNDVLASEDWAARPPFGAAVNQVLNSSEILEANRAVGVHGFEVKRAILADRELILQRTENRFLLIKLAVAALGAAGIFLVYLVGILLQVARSSPGSTSG